MESISGLLKSLKIWALVFFPLLVSCVAVYIGSYLLIIGKLAATFGSGMRTIPASSTDPTIRSLIIH